MSKGRDEDVPFVIEPTTAETSLPLISVSFYINHQILRKGTFFEV